MQIIKAVLVLVGIPAVFMCVFIGVPYFYRVFSNPWSWSLLHDDSITGTWVGTLHRPVATYKTPSDAMGRVILQEQLNRLPKSVPEISKDLVIVIRPHLQFFTWGTHLAGSAETCETGGPYFVLRFTMGDVAKEKISFVLGNRVDPAKGGGRVEGIKSSEVLAIKYQTDSGDWQGTLHKGTAADFQSACSTMGQSKQP